jgi:hypothetical protein
MSATPFSLDSNESGELVLELSDATHLFVAPLASPLSLSAVEARGIAGVDYLLCELHMDKEKQRARTLTLLLPAEKMPTANAQQITLALHRHVEWRLADERRELRNTYRYGWRVSGVALLLLAVCLALSSIFASEITEGMRPLVRKTLEYGFEIIGWVILWHPVDLLGFAPLSIHSRIAALKTLASIEVEIRPSQRLPGSIA